jgi:hypothetical protein
MQAHLPVSRRVTRKIGQRWRGSSFANAELAIKSDGR